MDPKTRITELARDADQRPGLRADHTNERLRIFRQGLAIPILTQHAAPDQRPFIHPILAPDGVGELTENEPGHHKWQHGLYVGLNAINGIGFWTEGRLEQNKDHDGTFHPRPLDPPRLKGSCVGWLVNAEWRSPRGEPMLNETQDWEFHDQQKELRLDLFWSVRALTDLVFGQYAYGGLFLRMPYRPALGGRAVNSEGVSNQDAEARRARWVTLEMPIPGREGCQEPFCSIAMLDHPRNPGHPVPWRVDGNLGVAPSRCITGEWRLRAGESQDCHYRLLIRCGGVEPKRIEDEWKLFANDKGDTDE